MNAKAHATTMPPPPATPRTMEDGPLIEARVIANRYDGKLTGAVVKVTERELRRVPHALISLAEEKRRAEEAAKPPAQNEGQLLYQQFLATHVGGAKVAREAQQARKRAELEAMGLEIKPKAG